MTLSYETKACKLFSPTSEFFAVSWSWESTSDDALKSESYTKKISNDTQPSPEILDHVSQSFTKSNFRLPSKCIVDFGDVRSACAVARKYNRQSTASSFGSSANISIFKLNFGNRDNVPVIIAAPCTLACGTQEVVSSLFQRVIACHYSSRVAHTQLLVIANMAIGNTNPRSLTTVSKKIQDTDGKLNHFTHLRLLGSSEVFSLNSICASGLTTCESSESHHVCQSSAVTSDL